MSHAAKKEETQVASIVAPSMPSTPAIAAPTHGVSALASDRTIPRLLLMQGQSQFVLERKAGLGDMVKSTTEEKLGDPEHPLDVIFLNQPIPSWRIEQKAQNGKFQFRGNEERTAKNDNLPWSFGRMPDGREVPTGTMGSVEWKRVKCLTCFVLLPRDIDTQVAEIEKVKGGAMPDLNKTLTPIVIQFRSTGIGAGKVVNDHYAAAKSFNIDGCNYVLQLSCVMDSNDSGVYYNFVVDRTKAKPVAEAHKATMLQWRDIVRGEELVIDEEREEVAPAGAANATSVC